MPLLALWGPTGVGKTTILRHALSLHADIALIDTYTSRPDRAGASDTKIPGTALPEDTTSLLITPFGGHHYFNAVADLSAAANDSGRLWLVDWVHHHSVDIRRFGPHTASVVLTASPVRTTWRLLRDRRTDRIPSALAQWRQFRREVYLPARTDPARDWQLLANGSRSPAETADALVAIGRAATPQ